MSATAVLWPQAEARRIMQRFPHAERYILETGFGPSGHPHMGTVGEVIRTHYVRMGLEELGKQGEIVVFSDDMDGLRKVPANIHAPWLDEHLGKPVSQIPDPYGCCSSFSAHMNNELKEMLQKTQVPYTFRNAADYYRLGEFDEAIRQIFLNLEPVLQVILPTLREETREGWHPFKPVCEHCGRVNTTAVEEQDLDRLAVRYHCIGEHKGAEGCGYRGEQSVLGGRGKMGWKVDWAVRWFTFGVNYEMYGKDLIESAKLAKSIVKIIGGRAPVDMFYELFLDQEGRKISKSVGEGFSFENWGRYGTAESLNLLMLKNPRQQKRLSEETLLQYMDETLTMSREDPQYPFVYYKGDRPELDIRFSDLVNIVAAVGMTDSEVLHPYLARVYRGNSVHEHAYLHGLVDKAASYYEAFMLPERERPDLTPDQWTLVDAFIGLIEGETTAEGIQKGVYDIARAHGMEPKEYFKLVYRVLLGQDHGPRIGSFVTLLGPDKIKEIIAQAKNNA